MPLSDKEQQILEEIERNLYEQDPAFARRTRLTLETHAVRNTWLGAGVFLLGFFVLVAFFVTELVPVGAVAFLTMLAGALITYKSLRRLGAEQLKSMKQSGGLQRLFEGFRRKRDPS